MNFFVKFQDFKKDELIGKEFKYFKYPDVANDIYTNLYANVLNNKPWQKKFKNIKKKMVTFYNTDAYVIPTFRWNRRNDRCYFYSKRYHKELNKKEKFN